MPSRDAVSGLSILAGLISMYIERYRVSRAGVSIIPADIESWELSELVFCSHPQSTASCILLPRPKKGSKRVWGWGSAERRCRKQSFQRPPGAAGLENGGDFRCPTLAVPHLPPGFNCGKSLIRGSEAKVGGLVESWLSICRSRPLKPHQLRRGWGRSGKLAANLQSRHLARETRSLPLLSSAPPELSSDRFISGRFSWFN